MGQERHSHCSWCGARFSAAVAKYARCSGCGQETWISPVPVTVLILPVEGADGSIGVLLVRRGIEPKKGEWGLPGGFLEQGESFEAGAVREDAEEAKVALPPDWPVRITHSRPVAGGKQVIVFCEAKPISDALLQAPFVPDAETEAIMLAHQPIELCFSTHTEALKMYFDRLRMGTR